MKLFPANAMNGQHCENYDVKRETDPQNVDKLFHVIRDGLMLSLEFQRVFHNLLSFCFAI